MQHQSIEWSTLYPRDIVSVHRISTQEAMDWGMPDIQDLPPKTYKKDKDILPQYQPYHSTFMTDELLESPSMFADDNLETLKIGVIIIASLVAGYHLKKQVRRPEILLAWIHLVSQVSGILSFLAAVITPLLHAYVGRAFAWITEEIVKPEQRRWTYEREMRNKANNKEPETINTTETQKADQKKNTPRPACKHEEGPEEPWPGDRPIRPPVRSYHDLGQKIRFVHTPRMLPIRDPLPYYIGKPMPRRTKISTTPLRSFYQSFHPAQPATPRTSPGMQPPPTPRMETVLSPPESLSATVFPISSQSPVVQPQLQAQPESLPTQQNSPPQPLYPTLPTGPFIGATNIQVSYTPPVDQGQNVFQENTQQPAVPNLVHNSPPLSVFSQPAPNPVHSSPPLSVFSQPAPNPVQTPEPSIFNQPVPNPVQTSPPLTVFSQPAPNPVQTPAQSIFSQAAQDIINNSPPLSVFSQPVPAQTPVPLSVFSQPQTVPPSESMEWEQHAQQDQGYQQQQQQQPQQQQQNTQQWTQIQDRANNQPPTSPISPTIPTGPSSPRQYFKHWPNTPMSPREQQVLTELAALIDPEVMKALVLAYRQQRCARQDTRGGSRMRV